MFLDNCPLCDCLTMWFLNCSSKWRFHSYHVHMCRLRRGRPNSLFIPFPIAPVLQQYHQKAAVAGNPTAMVSGFRWVCWWPAIPATDLPSPDLWSAVTSLSLTCLCCTRVQHRDAQTLETRARYGKKRVPEKIPKKSSLRRHRLAMDTRIPLDIGKLIGVLCLAISTICQAVEIKWLSLSLWFLIRAGWRMIEWVYGESQRRQFVLSLEQ